MTFGDLADFAGPAENLFGNVFADTRAIIGLVLFVHEKMVRIAERAKIAFEMRFEIFNETQIGMVFSGKNLVQVFLAQKIGKFYGRVDEQMRGKPEFFLFERTMGPRKT